MMEEKSSLEGWTKVVDKALQGWRDTEKVDASGTCETRSIVGVISL